MNWAWRKGLWRNSDITDNTWWHFWKSNANILLVIYHYYWGYFKKCTLITLFMLFISITSFLLCLIKFLEWRQPTRTERMQSMLATHASERLRALNTRSSSPRWGINHFSMYFSHYLRSIYNYSIYSYHCFLHFLLEKAVNITVPPVSHFVTGYTTRYDIKGKYIYKF